MRITITKPSCFNRGVLKGSQKKWFSNNQYIKADLSGYEGLAEEFASLFLDTVSSCPHVDYRTVSIYDETNLFQGRGCICDSYSEQGYCEVTLYDLLISQGYTEAAIQQTTGFDRWSLFETVLNEQELLYLLKLISLDLLILNDDRHLLNILFLYDKQGNRHFAPIFDNGAALLSDESLYSFKLSIADNRQKFVNRTLDLDYDSTLKFLRQLQVPKFVVDKSKVQALMWGYSENVLYRPAEIQRCKDVLTYQLQELEGVLWQAK